MACWFGEITRRVALDDTRQQVALGTVVAALTGVSSFAPEFVRAEAYIATAELEVAAGQKAGEGRSDDGASLEHDEWWPPAKRHEWTPTLLIECEHGRCVNWTAVAIEEIRKE